MSLQAAIEELARLDTFDEHRSELRQAVACIQRVLGDSEFATRLAEMRARTAQRIPALVEYTPIVSPIDELGKRLAMYHETGKRDYLLDVADYAEQQWEKDGC